MAESKLCLHINTCSMLRCSTFLYSVMLMQCSMATCCCSRLHSVKWT